MNKNIIIVLLSTLCVILIVISYNTTIENYQYKLYYEKAEKLLDEVEEDNEAYFDTDRGADYLYQRDKIKASKWRIKEWDYYYLGDEEYGIALTIDDNSYMGLVSASILDFKNKKFINCARMYWLCNGKVNLPNTSKDGSVSKNGKDYSFSFENNNLSKFLNRNEVTEKWQNL